MSDILMLDLEGVLIASAIPKMKYLKINDFGFRPYVNHFLDEVSLLFDHIYLNTVVNQTKASYIVNTVLGYKHIGYHEWDTRKGLRKASNYADFKDDTLIHVEDESEDSPIGKNCVKFGHQYIPVIPGWYSAQAWGNESKKYKAEDTILLTVLDKIKESLNQS